VKRKLILVSVVLIFVLVGCNKEDTVATENLDDFNETGMPIVDEPIELDFFARQAAVSNDNWNDVLVFNEYEDMTNMNINWQMVTDNVITEKLNLALGSGSLPDAFHTTFMSNSDMMKYGEQGVFIPLNDLIEEYAPNFRKILDENPIIEKQITFPDGNIYGFPKITDEEFIAYRTKAKPWINKKWLDNLGLDMPKTTEEFYEYLKAVKEGDPTGEGDTDIVPYGGREIDALITYLKGSFGVANKGTSNAYIDLDPETDELRFYPISDAYKELLEYLHKLYDEGLIAQNIFSIEDEQYRANTKKGMYGSTVFFALTVSVGGEKVEEFVGMPTLEGPYGDKEWVNVTPQVDNKSAFVITNENEHPEATVRWVDHFYGEEGMRLFFMGVEGETYEINDDGEPEYMDYILNSEEGNTIAQEQSKYLTFQGGGFPSVTTEEYFQGTAESSDEAIAAAEKLKPDLIEEPWPPFIHTEEEMDKLNSFGSDIAKYVDEMEDKFISGKTSLDEWDDYVNTIKKMNLDEYMDIKEAALERYEKN